MLPGSRTLTGEVAPPYFDDAILFRSKNGCLAQVDLHKDMHGPDYQVTFEVGHS